MTGTKGMSVQGPGVLPAGGAVLFGDRPQKGWVGFSSASFCDRRTMQM